MLLLPIKNTPNPTWKLLRHGLTASSLMKLRKTNLFARMIIYMNNRQFKIKNLRYFLILLFAILIPTKPSYAVTCEEISKCFISDKNIPVCLEKNSSYKIVSLEKISWWKSSCSHELPISKDSIFDILGIIVLFGTVVLIAISVQEKCPKCKGTVFDESEQIIDRLQRIKYKTGSHSIQTNYGEKPSQPDRMLPYLVYEETVEIEKICRKCGYRRLKIKKRTK
jgi:hypothetical protein